MEKIRKHRANRIGIRLAVPRCVFPLPPRLVHKGLMSTEARRGGTRRSRYARVAGDTTVVGSKTAVVAVHRVVADDMDGVAMWRSLCFALGANRFGLVSEARLKHPREKIKKDL